MKTKSHFRDYLFLMFIPFMLLYSDQLCSPLKNIPQRLKQPDGTVIHCFASGDEFYNWLHDKDGYTIVRDTKTGFYVYAVLERGQLKPSKYVFGRSDPKAAGIPKELALTQAEKHISPLFRNSNPHYNPAYTLANGNLSNLVIFVRFKDDSEFTEKKSYYENLFNDSSYGAPSVLNYFRDVSYNQLTIRSYFFPLSNDSIISYQDSHERAYYEEYDSVLNPIGYTGGLNGKERNSRELEMVTNAVNSMAAQVPASLNIDADGHGIIDHLILMIKGDCFVRGGILWPHKWGVYNNRAVINGKRLQEYNTQMQLVMLDGVGSTCHEMFHQMGAPDLYHYYYDPRSLEPLSKWDIMGSVLNPPQHMNAYSKYLITRWIESIPVISKPGTYSLYPSTARGIKSYKIPSPNSQKEYFIVEYRKKTGPFESSLPGEGLLIYRIISSLEYRGNVQGPPDEIYLYRPGGTTNTNGIPDSAFFSSNSGRITFNDKTDPSCFLYKGEPGLISIDNIGNAGDSISFNVSFTDPTFIPESPQSANNFIPDKYKLYQNYPNPFNPVTLLKYDLPFESSVKITVYNSIGKVVKELVNSMKSAGHHEVYFNAKGVSSGIYFYILEAGSSGGLKQFRSIKKMIVLR